MGHWHDERQGPADLLDMLDLLDAVNGRETFNGRRVIRLDSYLLIT